MKWQKIKHMQPAKATAKKKYNDEPPLEKKTIKKGHEIADKLMGMKKEKTIKEWPFLIKLHNKNCCKNEKYLAVRDIEKIRRSLF